MNHLTGKNIGRRIRSLPLPGDEDDFLEVEFRRVIRRDNRLTSREGHAKATGRTCAQLAQIWRRDWVCNIEQPCFYCEVLR